MYLFEGVSSSPGWYAGDLLMRLSELTFRTEFGFSLEVACAGWPSIRSIRYDTISISMGRYRRYRRYDFPEPPRPYSKARTVVGESILGAEVPNLVY